MKRDMDLIRRIVLAVADLPYGRDLSGLDGVPQEVFVTHVMWLKEAGLVDADGLAGTGSMAMYAIARRLTWNGCEFADAVANDGLWKKAKDNVLKPGLSFTFDTLKEWLKAEITQGFPTVRQIGQ